MANMPYIVPPNGGDPDQVKYKAWSCRRVFAGTGRACSDVSRRDRIAGNEQQAPSDISYSSVRFSSHLRMTSEEGRICRRGRLLKDNIETERYADWLGGEGSMAAGLAHAAGQQEVLDTNWPQSSNMFAEVW